MLEKFFTKQSPILGLLGLGGGISRGSGVVPFDASGGTKTTHGIYTIHVFEGAQSFTVNKGEKQCDILLVAGGGGGTGNGDQGGGGNGGGGGGGLIFIPASNSTSLLTPGTYTFAVGSAGEGGAAQPNPGFIGTQGGDTTLTTSNALGPLTALGGGYGQDPGGSGGGAGAGANGATEGTQPFNPTIPANSRTFGFGNDSGQGMGNEPQGYRGSGGGGAGAAGTPGAQGGQGGTGKPAPSMSASFAPLNPHGAFSEGGNGGARGEGTAVAATGYGGGGGGGSDSPGISGVDGTPGIAAIAYVTD